MRPQEQLTFPDTASEFYRLRDDRTNRVTDGRGYESASCLVTVDRAALQSRAGQVMLLAACNLLSRWCRQVTIELPEESRQVQIENLPGKPGLADLLLGVMYDADPFGAFEISGGARVSDGLRLHVGATVNRDVGQAVLINGSGWLAAVSTFKGIFLPAGDDDNVMGAIAAACLGVGEVFKRAVGVPEERLVENGIIDIFRLRKISPGETLDIGPKVERPELGKVLMVGAGSVGSSASYCLREARARCDLTLIDKDLVLVENFNRSPVFGRSNFGLNKAVAIARSLEGSSVRVRAFLGPWDRFISEGGRKSNGYDVWLPLADEENVRHSIQSNIPPLLIHASTCESWGVNHGRHIPGVDDCLLDRFPQVESDKLLGCATGSVETARGQVSAALPFLSLFAGLLVAADLIRLQVVGYPQVPNFAFVDFWGKLAAVQSWDMKPRKGCSCRLLSRSAHARLNGATKYFHLSFKK